MCNKPSPKPKVTYFQRKHENVFSIYIIPLQYRQLKFFFMEHVPGPSYLHNHQIMGADGPATQGAMPTARVSS